MSEKAFLEGNGLGEDDGSRCVSTGRPALLDGSRQLQTVAPPVLLDVKCIASRMGFQDIKKRGIRILGLKSVIQFPIDETNYSF